MPSATRVRALRATGLGQAPRLDSVPLHPPRGREVLVRVTAAGLCQSDLHIIDAPPPALAARMPFTLGHEIAGTVAEAGSEVTSVRVGDPVVVYGPWGCGGCARCLAGCENYCLRRAGLGFAGVGLGRDGGLADAVLVDHERHLAALAGLPPLQAAPLADAGLTCLHAIRLTAGRLPGDPVVAVIGVGGLGHLAIQLLRAITPSTVIAVDTRAEALELARECGAHAVVPAEAGAAGVLAANGGQGVDAVLDLVGTAGTIEVAVGVLRPGGDLVLVGSAGGRLTVDKSAPRLPPGTRISVPYWGARSELDEILRLARNGAIRSRVEQFPLEAAAEALSRLRSGTLLGRAVLVPG